METNVKICVATAVDNAAMRHVMTQLGYEPEPETFDSYAPNGDRRTAPSARDCFRGNIATGVTQRPIA